MFSLFFSLKSAPVVLALVVWLALKGDDVCLVPTWHLINDQFYLEMKSSHNDKAECPPQYHFAG